MSVEPVSVLYRKIVNSPNNMLFILSACAINWSLDRSDWMKSKYTEDVPVYAQNRNITFYHQRRDVINKRSNFSRNLFLSI